MPPRRTSPRRTATRRSGLYERTPEPAFDDDIDEPGDGILGAAAPWLAVLAVVLAAGAIAFVVFRGASSPDLTACRTAAWTAIPDPDNLPQSWKLASTDLNSDGMTISMLGPQPADSSTKQPAVYASITCYGDAAATALAKDRAAATSAGSKVTKRSANFDAYDIDNPTTGTLTTLFRVNGLVGQVANGGADPDDLAVITQAVAAAMGDETAAGTSAVTPTDAAIGSEEPLPTEEESLEPDPSAVAPELEADLPTSIQGTPLTVSSYTGTEALTVSPTSRALAARLTSLGVKLGDIQIAQAGDDSYTLDITVFGFRAPGLAPAKLKAAVLEAWLGADQPGVKQTTVTLGGKSLLKIDYGTVGSIDYVYATDDHVIVIDTADPNAASEAATQIK
jgi:hypothetical protein